MVCVGVFRFIILSHTDPIGWIMAAARLYRPPHVTVQRFPAVVAALPVLLLPNGQRKKKKKQRKKSKEMVQGKYGGRPIPLFHARVVVTQVPAGVPKAKGTMSGGSVERERGSPI